MSQEILTAIAKLDEKTTTTIAKLDKKQPRPFQK